MLSKNLPISRRVLLCLLKLAGLLAPESSSLAAPSRLKAVDYRYLTPLLQWRDRAGITPDFPIKLPP